MEKYITLNPPYPQYEEIFKNLNSILFSQYEKWMKLAKEIGFDSNIYYIEHLNWKDLLLNVPESIELWKITGECIGIHKNVPYKEFEKKLIENGFAVPHFGTGLWIPLELKKQNLKMEPGEAYSVFSPIRPYSWPEYKSWKISLSSYSSDSYPDGHIYMKLSDLRPTENWISPKTMWVVQNIHNK